MHWLFNLLLTISVYAQDPACLSIEGKATEKSLEMAMKDLSDQEVFVRLIFAETLASGCPSPEVAEGIAWVIRNRVTSASSTYGQGRGVVFKEKQFRSSTGTCDVARTPVFLCPTALNTHGGWKQWWETANAAFQKAQFPANNPLKQARRYYLFKHFDHSNDCAEWKGKLPAWTRAPLRVHPKNFSVNEQCIGFFR